MNKKVDFTNGLGKMKSIYRMSDPQPNWNQTDPSQPDYIKGKENAEQYRPIMINGEEVLSADRSSGALNIVGGRGVTLSIQNGALVISSRATGGGDGGTCDCPDYVEGEGIDVVENEYGDMVISVEKNGVNDDMIEAVSVSKLIQDDGDVIILNGGNN